MFSPSLLTNLPDDNSAISSSLCLTEFFRGPCDRLCLGLVGVSCLLLPGGGGARSSRGLRPLAGLLLLSHLGRGGDAPGGGNMHMYLLISISCLFSAHKKNFVHPRMCCVHPARRPSGTATEVESPPARAQTLSSSRTKAKVCRTPAQTVITSHRISKECERERQRQRQTRQSH